MNMLSFLVLVYKICFLMDEVRQYRYCVYLYKTSCTLIVKFYSVHKQVLAHAM